LKYNPKNDEITGNERNNVLRSGRRGRRRQRRKRRRRRSG
jgi:hypothetical protein